MLLFVASDHPLLISINDVSFYSQNEPEDESGYPVVKHGKLSLVDLAGKDRIHR